MKNLLFIFCFLTIWGCKKDSAPIPTVTISALPANVEYGKTAVVNWSSTNAISCTIDGKEVGISGSFTTQALTRSTNYNISAKGAGGSVNSSLTIGVGPDLVISFKDTTVIYGANLTFSWTASNATSCQMQGFSVQSSGSMEMKKMLRDTSLTIVGFGVGSVSKTVTIKVGDWTTSDLGLITYSYWMLKTWKYIQDGVVVQNVTLTKEEKEGHLQFGLDGGLYGNGVFSFNWSFGSSGHLLMNGWENDYSVTKTTLVISYASRYNSKPAIIELAYYRPNL